MSMDEWRRGRLRGTPTLDELAKHVVTLPGWRWMPGMRLLGAYGDRYPVRVCVFGERVFDTMDLDDLEWWQQPGGLDTRDGGPYLGPYFPDFTDAATTGCLLALVREALGWPDAYACHDDSGWFVSSGVGPWETQDEASPNGHERYPAEIEALVAALEAAPVTR